MSDQSRVCAWHLAAASFLVVLSGCGIDQIVQELQKGVGNEPVDSDQAGVILASPQEAAEAATVQAEAAAEEIKPEDLAKSFSNDHLRLYRQMNDALESVVDVESAERAAKTIESLSSQMDDLVGRIRRAPLHWVPPVNEFAEYAGPDGEQRARENWQPLADFLQELARFHKVNPDEPSNPISVTSGSARSRLVIAIGKFRIAQGYFYKAAKAWEDAGRAEYMARHIRNTK